MAEEDRSLTGLLVGGERIYLPQCFSLDSGMGGDITDVLITTITLVHTINPDTPHPGMGKDRRDQRGNEDKESREFHLLTEIRGNKAVAMRL